MALLLVPAINLSGMISSRMDDRLAEMGIQRWSQPETIVEPGVMGESASYLYRWIDGTYCFVGTACAGAQLGV